MWSELRVVQHAAFWVLPRMWRRARKQSCSIARCAMEQEAVVTYCYECTKFPCKRYAEADLYDSFITHRHRMQDFARMKECGAEVYHATAERENRNFTKAVV